MDVLSLIGLLLAFVAIVGGNFLEGGHISALLNGPAALIVLGGTLGAVLLQTPIAVFMRAMSIGRWIFFPPRIDLARGILMVTTWSNTARKEGLLGLEPVAETEPDPYARKGLQLLVDGAEPEVIRSILEVDLYTQEGRDLRAAKVYEHGRLLSDHRNHRCGDGADPCDGQPCRSQSAGQRHRRGVRCHHLWRRLCKPAGVAGRQQAQEHRPAADGLPRDAAGGVLSIAEGENPRSIEMKLQGFMD